MSKIKDKWEYYGKNDPYFAVVTLDEFRRDNLSEIAKNQFFQTGNEYIEKIWQEIEANFAPDFSPERALDFGCGVGRLVVPLAGRCKTIVGVDISEEMLREAARNTRDKQINNTEFQQTDEFLQDRKKKFDFVHSFIVFQHINPEIGFSIIKNILEKLEDNGIGALHFTYYNPTSAFQAAKFKVYRDYPFVYKIKGAIFRNGSEPLIPMYVYDLNKLFTILQENKCGKTIVHFSDHGYKGVLIIFQKQHGSTLKF